VCGTSFLPVGTPLAVQTAGDCQIATCDGAGATAGGADDTDLPDDANDCTDDLCTMGMPSFVPKMAEAACGQGMVCDGNGLCVGCLMPSDCAGQDGPCQTRTCTNTTCGVALVDAGTLLAAQITGDCKVDACDGLGAVVSSADDTDLPDDANDCTGNVCSMGVPSNPPSVAGAACGLGMFCNGNGACVGCLTANDCPGQNGPCQSRTCIANTCGIAFVATGMPVGAQTAGDCKSKQCDGAGAPVVVNDGTDVPVDNNACTGDVCTAGAPSNPALAVGALCNQGGGSVCNGAAACIPTIQVVRVGDGLAALTANAAPIFLEQRLITGALLVKASNPLALPVAVNGLNRPLTLGGTQTSEGNLSLSSNGSYLTIAGYDAVPGTANVASIASATVNRVIGRIDASGNVDTSTRLDSAFSGSNVRGATSNDGTSFWVTGNGNGGTGGLHYSMFGVTGSNQIMTLPNNTRFCQVQGGQLYATGGATPNLNVFSVGVGTPSSAGQTATGFNGMPGTVTSPYAFAIFDRNPNVPGDDTLYVADDRGFPGGGVQKWTFDGTTWTLVNTFTNGATVGSRGLAAVVTGNNVTIVATTTNSKVIVYVDDGSAVPPGTVIATAALNTVYRGVAISAK
jgi:hypothetical protein